MLTTKRYDYVPFEAIRLHPDIANHRPLNLQKVLHYEQDIHRNGLLEPLVVWEKLGGEFFLVGGFHRRAAIQGIREKYPGHFDRVDVRVVAGDFDEIRALNLKLNADRLDAKITDFFDTVIFLNNANWTQERIAGFLDKSVTWVGDIIRYAPVMDARVRRMLEEGKLSWNRAKAACRAVLEAPAGDELSTMERELSAVQDAGNSPKPRRKPLSFRTARARLSAHSEKHANAEFIVKTDDLLALLNVLEGKQYDEGHLERVRATFPGLLD